jgi:hypothetical protein
MGADSPGSDGAAPLIQKGFSLKWGWPGITFSLTRRTFVVSRKRDTGERVHFTIGFANKSGEIDLHLTREQPQDSEQVYVPLAQISPTRIARFAELFNGIGNRLAFEMLTHWNPVRPGWLERRGYYVFLVDKEPSQEMLDRFRAFFPDRKRRKYLVTLSPLSDPSYWSQFADHLFPAGILRYVQPHELQLPMQATSRIGRNPRLSIASFDTGNGPRWYMLPWHRTVEVNDKMMAAFFALIGPGVTTDHGAILQQIVDALGLAEVPELNDFLAGIQGFLASPKETIDKVQRQARAWTPAKKKPMRPGRSEDT